MTRKHINIYSRQVSDNVSDNAIFIQTIADFSFIHCIYIILNHYELLQCIVYRKFYECFPKVQVLMIENYHYIMLLYPLNIVCLDHWKNKQNWKLLLLCYYRVRILGVNYMRFLNRLVRHHLDKTTGGGVSYTWPGLAQSIILCQSRCFRMINITLWWIIISQISVNLANLLSRDIPLSEHHGNTLYINV